MGSQSSGEGIEYSLARLSGVKGDPSSVINVATPLKNYILVSRQKYIKKHNRLNKYCNTKMFQYSLFNFNTSNS